MFVGLGVAGGQPPAHAGPQAAAAIAVGSTGDASATEVALASKYSPRLYIGGTASSCRGTAVAERPLPVDAVLDNPAVTLREAGTSYSLSPVGAAGLYQKPAGFYLDYPGNPTSPGCTYDSDYQALASKYPAVVYAHIQGEAGFDGFALQYWFFYYINDWNNKHEGDWEMIQVIFSAPTAEAALEQEPVGVTYAQHGSAQRANWSDSALQKDGDHPLVFVSTGSHSSQMAAAQFIGKGESGSGLGCDDSSAASRLVTPNVALMPSTVVSGTDPFAWLNYDGQWGQKLSGENDGPTGPNTKTQWTRPLSWDRSQHTGSLRLPEQLAFGGSGLAFFCGAMRVGSVFYLQASNQPIVVLGIIIAAVVALATMAVAFVRSAVDERGIPVGSPQFFIRDRSFDQLMWASTRLYRRHWRAFLTVSAVFVPLGLLLSEAQQLIFSIPVVSTLVGVADSRGISGFVALLYGTGATLPVTLVVTAGVVAVVAQSERGGTVSGRDAYRRMAHDARPLIYARLKAILITATLAATVIGLPWAINRLVRWFFSEQAILLDGATEDLALQRSSESVDGRWWKTFFVVAILAELGGLVGPLLASIAFLLTSLPLGLINLFSSIVYAALMPLVGIGLALYYRQPRTVKSPSARSEHGEPTVPSSEARAVS